jgi:HAD superfamily hydrolase (TIGR01490 family)
MPTGNGLMLSGIHGTGQGAAHRAAFVDVDETLVAANTLASLLEHLQPGRSAEPGVGTLRTARSALRRLAISGEPRERQDRECYRLYAGQPVGAIAVAGREWFAAASRRPGFFHQPVLRELHEHRERGDLIVLVSGSFPAVLNPIARYVRADAVLASAPATAAGVYTGEVDLLAGAAKGAAVRGWMAEHGLPPADCTAYGDQAGDLSMLLQVGHPVMVGTDEVLAEYAERCDWRRLPAALGGGPATTHLAAA